MDLKVTFNVIEAGRFNLGFLLGMDVLEKHGFLLNASTRSVYFLKNAMSQEKLASCACTSSSSCGRLESSLLSTTRLNRKGKKG